MKFGKENSFCSCQLNGCGGFLKFLLILISPISLFLIIGILVFPLNKWISQFSTIYPIPQNVTRQLGATYTLRHRFFDDYRSVLLYQSNDHWKNPVKRTAWAHGRIESSTRIQSFDLWCSESQIIWIRIEKWNILWNHSFHCPIKKELKNSDSRDHGKSIFTTQFSSLFFNWG